MFSRLYGPFVVWLQYGVYRLIMIRARAVLLRDEKTKLLDDPSSLGESLAA